MKKSEQAHIPHHPTLPDNTTRISCITGTHATLFHKKLHIEIFCKYALLC